MNAGRGRQRAYSDLLTGLIDLGPTTASHRFDELLDEARAQGRIDDDTARVLRWWQREAVRAQGDHVLTTAPALLAALDEAQADAIESAASAQSAWTTATATPQPPPPAPAETPAAAPAPAKRPSRSSGARHAAPEDAPTPTVATTEAPSGTSGIPGLDRVADTPLFDQVAAVREATPSDDAAPAAPVAVPTVAAAPNAPIEETLFAAPNSDQPGAQVLTSAAPARRRRLLVAGLTVIEDGKTMPSIADPP